MSNAPKTPDGQPTTRRELLLGSAAILTATTAAAANEKPADKLTVEPPLILSPKKDRAVRQHFVASGTGVNLVGIEAWVSRDRNGDSKDWPMTRFWISGGTRWSAMFNRVDAGDSFYLSVEGIKPDGSRTTRVNQKVTVNEVSVKHGGTGPESDKKFKIKSAQIEGLQDNDPVDLYLVVTGTYANGHDVTDASMTKVDESETVLPLSIVNDSNCFAIEFVLKENTTYNLAVVDAMVHVSTVSGLYTS